jgi:hypothetical protein
MKSIVKKEAMKSSMKMLKNFFKNIDGSRRFLQFLLLKFCRFYPECRDHVLPSGLYETDNYLGWRLAKEKSGNHHSKYFDVIYTTNSLGFRDKERIIQKEYDKFKILLYGDSQIFGWGVSAEERFSNLLRNLYQMRNLEFSYTCLWFRPAGSFIPKRCY